jgi:hypothetical protein
VVEDGLYRDPDLARFYDLENGWTDDLDDCRKFERERSCGPHPL